MIVYQCRCLLLMPMLMCVTDLFSLTSPMPMPMCTLEVDGCGSGGSLLLSSQFWGRGRSLCVWPKPVPAELVLFHIYWLYQQHCNIVVIWYYNILLIIHSAASCLTMSTEAVSLDTLYLFDRPYYLVHCSLPMCYCWQSVLHGIVGEGRKYKPLQLSLVSVYIMYNQ
jgi:hypothetical protein